MGYNQPRPNINEERKKVESVVNGQVKVRKKSELRKLAGMISPNDSGERGSYIWTDIIIPTAKDVLHDIFSVMLYGEKVRKPNKSAGNSRTPYRNYFSAPEDNRSVPARVKFGYEVQEVIVDNPRDADGVLAELDSIIQEYGTARVSEFYEAVGIQPRFTDYKYGWSDLRNAGVEKVREGWLIKLPRPTALN